MHIADIIALTPFDSLFLLDPVHGERSIFKDQPLEEVDTVSHAYLHGAVTQCSFVIYEEWERRYPVRTGCIVCGGSGIRCCEFGADR